MSFLGSIANSLADKVKRAAGVVPPYEVVEATPQQFAKFVAVSYCLYLLSSAVIRPPGTAVPDGLMFYL